MLNDLTTKSYSDFMNDAEFHEDLAIMAAQERIAELMKEKGISRAELAQLLGKSKAFVTKLLSDRQNLTIRTFANVLYHLGEDAEFGSIPIKRRSMKPVCSYSYNFNTPSLDKQICGIVVAA